MLRLVVALSTFLALRIEVYGACNSPWTSVGGACFQLFSNNHHTWRGAEDACERLGARLATIRNIETQEGLKKLVNTHGPSGNDVWIGAHRVKNWKWVNGAPVRYYKWAHEQPEDAGDTKQNRIMLWHGHGGSQSDYSWNDENGDAEFDGALPSRYICQMYNRLCPTIHLCSNHTQCLLVPYGIDCFYVANSVGVTWEAAELNCEKLISVASNERAPQLAMITDEALQTTLVLNITDWNISDGNYWIGGKFDSGREKFAWHKNYSDPVEHFTTWQNEHDPGNCVSMSAVDNKWHVKSCTILNDYVCEKVDACSILGCLEGVCVEVQGLVECQCHDGYTGEKCDQSTAGCSGLQCVNGACSEHSGHAECLCHHGYTGKHCDEFNVHSTVQLFCESSFMTIWVNMTRLRVIYNDSVSSSLAIGDECYEHVTENDIAKFHVAYNTSCYTQIETFADHFLFKNYINYQPGDRQNSIISWERWRVNFQCNMERLETTGDNLNTSAVGGTVPGTSNVNPIVTIYMYSNFTYQITNSPIGTTVYIDVSVGQLSGTKMVTKQCIASPSDVTRPETYTLFTDGPNRCVVQPTVKDIHQTGHTTRFSMLVFRFPHVEGFVNIHCDVTMCKISDISSACHSHCGSP